MQNRWARGFTVVELIIVIVVIAILAIVSVVGYNGVTKLTLSTASKSDLQNLNTSMQRTFQKTGQYPTAMPTDFSATDRIEVTLDSSGAMPFYDSLTPVQSGVLFAKVCEDLVSEGVGKGTSQGGQPREYITSCGNWNDDSMQFTGWDSKVWATPVQKQPLLDYANNFTAPAWDKDQERVMKTFYAQLVQRYEQQGGKFPLTSFWDYWATPANGGVMQQPLDPNAPTKPYYCAEAHPPQYPDLIWHVTEKGKIVSGAC